MSPYDPERDPGRSDPIPEPPAPDAADSGVLGAVGAVMAWPVLVAESLIQDPTPASSTGGGMSLQDTIAQITTLQRAVQDQTRLVNDFLRANRDTIQLVRTELKGSTKGYDEQMLNALAQAESSLNTSLSSLQQASSALDRVRAI